MIPGIEQYGFAVAVGGALVGFLIWSARRQQAFLQDLVTNHMAHNTAALLLIKDAVKEAVAAAQESARLTGELLALIRDRRL